jgi:hypothetical protein
MANIHTLQREMWETVSLVLRFYRGLSLDANEWRGQVEHIPSSGKFSFHGVNQLIQVLKQFSDRKDEASLKEDKHESQS